MSNREENLRLLKLAAEGKLRVEDFKNQQPGWRIWLNLKGLSREQYIQDCIDQGIPPPPANARYKITLNLAKT